MTSTLQNPGSDKPGGNGSNGDDNNSVFILIQFTRHLPPCQGF